jgi:xanthine dehydrogenase, small subunit
MRRAIRFLRRNETVEVRNFEPRTTLLDWLRLTERSTGTKEGCGEGDCGACTVVLRRLVDGRLVSEPVNACILLLGQVDGVEVLTVEDLAADGHLHPVQQAMVERHGSQCGFCTPGIVMSLLALYETGEVPDRQGVTDALAGNLCRCTGYRPIVEAAFDALGRTEADPFAQRRPQVAGMLEALRDEADVFVGDERSFFAAPASIETLARLYREHPDATLVAGATDVGLWVTKALAELPKIIWLGRVAALDAVVEDGETLTLGATATLARARGALGALDPDLDELMRRFGSQQVRASGTVGGNIANGSPIGDLAPALIALGATLHLRRGDGHRSVPLEDFFLDYRKQDRMPGEFVTGVTARKPAGRHVRAFKVTKRFDEDISAVMGAFCLDVADGVVREARIAYGGMAGIPKRARAAEAALTGAAVDDRSAAERAVAALDTDFAPLTDHRASAAYRRRVAGNLLKKALMEIATGDDAATRLIAHREVRHAAE